jgi:hypothetical protein
LPGEQGHREKVVTVDPGVVASDLREFVELPKIARTLDDSGRSGHTKRHWLCTRTIYYR